MSTTKRDIDQAIIRDLEWLRTDAQHTDAWRGTKATDVGVLDLGDGSHTSVALQDAGDGLLHYAEERWEELADRPYCEECHAVQTEHVDVEQVDDLWYGSASGKVDLCEPCRVERIPELARECADEADRAAAPGQLEVADPMGGDWQALSNFLGREPTDAERGTFAGAYRARLSDHVQSRPEVQ